MMQQERPQTALLFCSTMGVWFGRPGARMGKSARRRRLDLPAGGCDHGAAGLLCGPARKRAGNVWCGHLAPAGDWYQRNDARVSRVRPGGPAPRTLPHLAEHNDGAGAALLDVSGRLQAGIPLCPPEGDGGTGMVATGAVARRTGNVSAGTSVFGMVVLEHGLS